MSVLALFEAIKLQMQRKQLRLKVGVEVRTRKEP